MDLRHSFPGTTELAHPTAGGAHPEVRSCTDSATRADHPARTGRPLLARLHPRAVLVKVLAMPDIRKRLENLVADPMSTTPQESAAYIEREKKE